MFFWPAKKKGLMKKPDGCLKSSFFVKNLQSFSSKKQSFFRMVWFLFKNHFFIMHRFFFFMLKKHKTCVGFSKFLFFLINIFFKIYKKIMLFHVKRSVRSQETCQRHCRQNVFEQKSCLYFYLFWASKTSRLFFFFFLCQKIDRFFFHKRGVFWKVPAFFGISFSEIKKAGQQNNSAYKIPYS